MDFTGEVMIMSVTTVSNFLSVVPPLILSSKISLVEQSMVFNQNFKYLWLLNKKTKRGQIYFLVFAGGVVAI